MILRSLRNERKKKKSLLQNLFYLLLKKKKKSPYRERGLGRQQKQEDRIQISGLRVWGALALELFHGNNFQTTISCENDNFTKNEKMLNIA